MSVNLQVGTQKTELMDTIPENAKHVQAQAQWTKQNFYDGKNGVNLWNMGLIKV